MATDRVEMERGVGGTFLMVEYGYCHDHKTIHVNDVNVGRNKVITGIGAVAGVIAVVALWQVGVVAWISVALPVIIYGAQLKSAETFNAYKIRPTK
jgi:hypothetical protein